MTVLLGGFDGPIPFDINFEELLPSHLWIHEVADDFVDVSFSVYASPLLELLKLRGPDLLILSSEEERRHGHILVSLVGLVHGPDHSPLLGGGAGMKDAACIMPLWHN